MGAKQHDQGRRRLPPPATICSATVLTSGTLLASRVRITPSTAERYGCHQRAYLVQRHPGHPNPENPREWYQFGPGTPRPSDCLTGGNRTIRMRGLSDGSPPQMYAVIATVASSTGLKKTVC